MECGGCGRGNREGASFCAGCGRRLVARCAACANELEPDARFCDSCGAPVERADPVPAPAAGTPLAGDRKIVTVLFADLAGSTSMQERLDAESTARLMERVQGVLAAAVEAHGGRVVKSTGDGVMAVFGIPLLREDDARRAVASAVEMQTSFAAVAEDIERVHGVDVALRVGVNTGEVVVSPDSADVVGDPVNVAARLEGAAGVGEVLVGPETARLVRDHVGLEDVEPLVLKGKSEPVPAARVTGVDRPRPVAQAFLGREADLGAVLRHLDLATEQQTARLVTVVGFPGLGKSRLAAEVVARVADRATVVDARFVADAASSFGPIAAALREAVDPHTLPLGDETQRVAETVAALAAGSSAGSTEQVFWSIRRCLEALAAERPVLVVLDDLQWAEPAMLDLVDHLTEWLVAPVVVLALARPELRDVRPSLLDAGGPSAAVFVLDGLDEDASRQLALDVLDADQLPEGVLERTLDASEGNPLFLRELLRLLVDDGVLVRSAGRWTVTVEVDAIELPASVHATIAARIEQLDPDERAVLQAAAVVGRHFARGAVAALLPEELADRLDPLLTSLHRRTFVDPEGTWWDDERMFRFHHVLIRDAAYRRILKEVRAELHVRYADWLSTRPGEHDEALGHHLAQAVSYRVELGDDVDPALVDRAVARLASAGRRTLDADDVVNAASLLGRALELAPGDRVLLRDRAEALVASGDMNAAAAAVAELAAAADDERSRAIADVFEAQLAGQRTPDTLRQVAERAAAAAAVLATHDDDPGVAKAEAVQATALAGLGQVGACEAALDRSLAAARRAGDARLANVVLSIAPAAALWGPSPVARASGRCLDVVRVLRITTWAPQVEARALQAQAVLEALRGRADAARRMLESARQTFADLGHRFGLLEASMHAGLVELLADRPAEAEACLREARQGFEALGSRVAWARATALLARALLELDRLEEAEQLADPTLGGDDLKASIGLLGVAAEISARQGANAEAEALARKAVSLAATTDALVDHADARLSLARVLDAAGKHAQAGEERHRARALYEEKGATVGVDRARSAPAGAGAVGAPETERRPSDPADPPGRRRIRPNLASATVEAWTRDVTAGRSVAQWWEPDLVWEDRTLQTAIVDHQLVFEWEMIEHAGVSVEVDIIATLGERHVLTRMTSRWSDEDAGDVEWTRLFACRVNEAGRFTRFDTFHGDDLEAALACLYERWGTDELGLTPDRARAHAVPLSLPAMINERDWDGLRRSLTADAVLVDHRPTGSGAVHGADAVAGWFQAFVDHTDALLTRMIDLFASEPLRLLSKTETAGQVDGSPFSAQALSVIERAPDGRFRRLEVFPSDRLEAAYAAYDRLGASTTERRVEQNLATETIARWTEAMRRHDEEALTAMIGESFVWSSEPLHIEAAPMPIDEVRIIPVGADIDTEIVAALGDRHCYYRLIASWDDGAAGHVDWSGSYVLRVNGDGTFARIDCFDHGQIAPAAACLVERWAEDELGPAAGQRARGIARGLRIAEPYEARDWDAVRSVCADEIEFVDHRLAAAGELRGPDAVIAWLRPFVDPIEDLRAEVTDVHGLTPRAALVTWRSSGVLHGAPLETDAFIVSRWDDRGAIDRMGMFALDRFDDAMACFARFDGAPPKNRRIVPNLATRYAERMIGSRSDLEPLATLGERQALFRVRNEPSHQGPGGVALRERLLVTQVGPDGQCAVREDAFPPDHFARALRCLAERWAEGELEGPQRQRGMAIASAGCRFSETIAARDWNGYRSLFSDDVVQIDHRPTSAGRLDGADAVVAWVRELDAVAGPITVTFEDVFALTPDGGIFRTLSAAETDAGPVCWPSLLVSRFDDEGRCARSELYAVEDADEAWECFDRLVRSPSGEPVDEEVARLGSQSLHRGSDGRFAIGRKELDIESFDRALEALVRAWAANDHPGDPIVEQCGEAMVRALQLELVILAGDWSGLRAICDERVVMIDHNGSSGRIDGVEPIRRWAEPVTEIADDLRVGATAVLAFRPDALLCRSTTRGSVDEAPFESDALVLMRFAPDGRLASFELFAADASDDALAALDGPPLVRHHRVRPNLAWAAVQRRSPVEHVVTAGERHTLWRDTDERLVLTRCDLEGNIVEETRMDDLHDAGPVLGASLLAHENLRMPLGRGVRLAAAITAADWVEVRDGYNDDIVFIDRRPTSAGAVVGGDEVVGWIQAFGADHFDICTSDVLAVSPGALLYQLNITGTAAGMPFETQPLIAARLDEESRFVHQENFEPGQLEDAWDCYERLASQVPDNDVVRVLRRYATALARRDLEAAVAANAPDVVNHDRRPLVGGEPRIGRDGARAETKAILDFGKDVLMTVEPVETRGDRLAMIRQAIGVDRVIEYLVVSECDAAGQMLTRNLMFDESQFDEAMAELDSLEAQHRHHDREVARP